MDGDGIVCRGRCAEGIGGVGNGSGRPYRIPGATAETELVYQALVVKVVG